MFFNRLSYEKWISCVTLLCVGVDSIHVARIQCTKYNERIPLRGSVTCQTLRGLRLNAADPPRTEWPHAVTIPLRCTQIMNFDIRVRETHHQIWKVLGCVCHHDNDRCISKHSTLCTSICRTIHRSALPISIQYPWGGSYTMKKPHTWCDVTPSSIYHDLRPWRREGFSVNFICPDKWLALYHVSWFEHGFRRSWRLWAWAWWGWWFRCLCEPLSLCPGGNGIYDVCTCIYMDVWIPMMSNNDTLYDI